MIYQYFNMAPRLLGQSSTFGVVFFVSKSPVGIDRQKKLEKFAILTRKPRSHVRILIYRTWPIGSCVCHDGVLCYQLTLISRSSSKNSVIALNELEWGCKTTGLNWGNNRTELGWGLHQSIGYVVISRFSTVVCANYQSVCKIKIKSHGGLEDTNFTSRKYTSHLCVAVSPLHIFVIETKMHPAKIISFLETNRSRP